MPTRDIVPTPIEALETMMDQLPAMNTDEVVARTLARLLNATAVDELFKNPDSQGLRDWAGQVIIINRVVGCLPSTTKGQLSRYVVLDCTDPSTGDMFAATTGGLYACSAVLRAAELGLLPLSLRVVELESASNPGQSSLWLVKP